MFISKLRKESYVVNVHVDKICLKFYIPKLHERVVLRDEFLYKIFFWNRKIWTLGFQMPCRMYFYEPWLFFETSYATTIKKVEIWPFFPYEQFSNTVLGYKKGSKMKSDTGFRSATNKMWVVIFALFPKK